MSLFVAVLSGITDVAVSLAGRDAYLELEKS
jgi:hypothetical protein